MVRRLTCLVAGLLPLVSEGAEPASRTPWSTHSSAERCSLYTTLADANGKKTAANLALDWRRASGHWLQLTLLESVPAAPWTLDSAGKGAALRVLSGGSRARYTDSRIENGEQLVRELSAGSSLVLTLHGPAASRFTTPTNGSASSRAFQECVARVQAAPAPQEPPPRWSAETSGSRNCSLSAAMPGVPGARILFHVGAKSSLVFFGTPAIFQNPGGGALRVEQSGLQPWIVDSEKVQATADSRETRLLEALIGRKTLPMTFTPRGAQSVAFLAPLGNIEVAGPMFRACMNAVKAPDLPPQLSLAELHYSVTETGKACELSGTFQIEGNAIWLVLSTDGGKHTVKVTRRMVKAGRPIEAIDLGALGGPKDFTGLDAA